MRLFDDTLPEETSEEYEQVLALLSHVSRKPTLPSAEEQAEALARVQERLHRFEEQSAHGQGEGMATQEVEPVSVAVQYRGRERTRVRQGRMLRFVNTFAAVLVIGAIIGMSLLLFRHSSPASGGKPSQVASPPIFVTSVVEPGKHSVTILTGAGGLEASLGIMAGPYFLGELVEVDATLMNNSHTTYQLQGFSGAIPCDPALSVSYTLAGANTAHYTIPAAVGAMSCPLRMSLFKPGQTLAVRWYIPLTDSGKIVLTEDARFLVAKTTPGEGAVITDGSSPLDGKWPALHIDVSSRVPSDRVITLHRNGAKVFVYAPVAARSHLLYLYTVSCSDFSDSGSTASGNGVWTVTGTTISEPGCPGKNIQWKYAVSAPGYAIASGTKGS